MDKSSGQKSSTIRDVPCPFCGILCDDLVIQNQGNKLKVEENGCKKAIKAFQRAVPDIQPKLKGKNVSLDDAVKAICTILNQSHTPLFSGLGTDAAGMRQILNLADKTGAIIDHMHGDALIRNTLVLQDLGWITTTMAEIKNRADLIIFAGTDASNYPRFFERVIWNGNSMFNVKNDNKQIVYIGEKLNTRPGTNPNGKKPTVLNCKTEQIGEIISSLHALIVGESLDLNEIAGIKVSALKTLTEKMKTASYGVIVWSPADLNIPHAELTIQNFCEIVKYLTRITRFAGFSLGGNDGATTANNISAWQSGYPLRVNFNKGYPEYDAHRYSTHNVLKHKEVDSMLWVSSFNPDTHTPHASIPTIVLATPDIKLDFKPDVFIPVATPGVDHKGQLFRTDSVVALPIKQVRESKYPSVNSILEKVMERL